jgi:hypothetical protein
MLDFCQSSYFSYFLDLHRHQNSPQSRLQKWRNNFAILFLFATPQNSSQKWMGMMTMTPSLSPRLKKKNVSAAIRGPLATNRAPVQLHVQL